MRHRDIARAAEREGLRPLPDRAAALLDAIAAPPRLIAHHLLVHDVACQLLASLAHPSIDAAAVAFGAATHDIGKALVPAELSAPGSLHESRGHRWLVERGVPPELARFARTHGAPVSDPAHTSEDLLVVLADKCWKGKRVAALEERVARAVAPDPARFIETLLLVTDIVERIAERADWRLAWQNSHPA